ncbi:MAG TPA: hypothetical protein IAA32_06405 [Candidatus Butyricicoccus stercorigallinarum]|nr:hypothetical protein [Candidatus Butyricicoccus stercorigallinarum]
MKQFSFVFLVMSPDHDHTVHRTQMESPMCKSIMIGVNSIEDACAQAKQLADAGAIRKIELCGAFGKEGAQAVRDAVGDSVIVSYIVNLE